MAFDLAPNAIMRGRPSDYDDWDDILRGNNDGARWDWSHVLPHFRRMEGTFADVI